MTPRQLEYFLAVAENGGFIRAAESLSISQTAVTKQVQLLERSLGCQLFDRSGKAARLTDAGRFFVGQARQALAALDKAEDNMRAHLAGERGTLRLGFITYMDQDLLVRVFSGYSRLHPNVRLSFLSSSSRALCQMVREGELDAYIGIGTSWNEDLTRTLVRSYPLVAVVPCDSGLAGRAEVRREELKDVIYDVGEMISGMDDYQPLEGVLLQVACGFGSAIVHSFAATGTFAGRIATVGLAPSLQSDIFLMSDPTRVSPLVDGLRGLIGSEGTARGHIDVQSSSFP